MVASELVSRESGVVHGPQRRYLIGSAEPAPAVSVVRTPDGDHVGDAAWDR